MAAVKFKEFPPPGAVDAGPHGTVLRNVPSLGERKLSAPHGQEDNQNAKPLREPVVSSFVLESSQLLFLKGQKWSKFI